MNIVLLGMPGAGKGTQAKFIKDNYKLTHISTGDMFREAISSQSPMGVEAKKYMDKGELVPDNVVLGMVKERISNSDCDNGFMLDGFPRTKVQAQEFDKMLSGMGRKLDMVLDFVITADEAVKRLSSRRTCPQCSYIYNLQSDKFEEDGKCNKCKVSLLHRSDDKEEVILNRLKVYNDQTAVLKDYYRDGRVLKTIDAQQSPEKISQDLKALL